VGVGYGVYGPGDRWRYDEGDDAFLGGDGAVVDDVAADLLAAVG
jgi:hypothetical protein